MEVVKTKTAKNHNYDVSLKDYTIVKDYIMELKPKKEIGIKYSNWLKSLESYNTHYAKSPYWIQVTFWDDDDMIMQREFSNLADAESMFMELATCQEFPDFKRLEFR